LKIEKPVYVTSLRIFCLIVGVIGLGFGGVYGSQQKRLDGDNWFVSFLMCLAGLFFALGVMPINDVENPMFSFSSGK